MGPNYSNDFRTNPLQAWADVLRWVILKANLEPHPSLAVDVKAISPHFGLIAHFRTHFLFAGLPLSAFFAAT